MKHESGINKAGQNGDEGGNNLLSMIGNTIPPGGSQDKAGSVKSATQDHKRGKAKVIPLRQEDVNLSNADAKRKRVMMGLVVVLSIVFGFILLRPSGTDLNISEKPQKTGSLADKNIISKSAVASIWNVPDKVSEGVRDITKSGGSQSESVNHSSLPELQVRGIVVYNDDKKSAIIGDMIVKVGDVIKGVKIYMITTDSVVFEKDGVKWTEYVE